MLSDYRCQVSLGLYNDPDQNASNTWYFRGISAGTSEQDDLIAMQDLLSDFYAAIDTYLPSSCFDGRTEVLYYNMADPEPRVPLQAPASLAGFAPAAGTAHPSDVAICLSYRADYVSGDARGRKRGRMFFGPVLASTGANVADEGLRIQSTVRTAFVTAAQALVIDAGTNNLQWRMYSPTNGDFPLLKFASVNDQYDTRRSRDKPGFTTTQGSLAQ